MASRTITNSPADHLIDLKHAFAAAVEELDSEKADRAKTPIYPRKAVAAAKSSIASQKRALTDAADALAALWRTSTRSRNR